MIDRCNRTIDYLRISITDRCNMRCIYCMPESGVEWIPHDQILTYEEIIRLCRIFTSLGLKKVKITGGEPLVRKNVAALIECLKKESGVEIVTLTTNGILLGSQLDALTAAGLDGVNISIDAVDAAKFRQITRRPGAEIVTESIRKALAVESLNVKINCVPMGINDRELIKLAELAKDHRLCVRFIEMMPIGLGKNLEYRSENDIKAMLESKFGTMIPYGHKLGNGPSHYFSVPGFVGKIGFISAISHKFCDNCNRVRLTAAGFLKTCLQYEKGVDLKQLMKHNEDDRIIKEAVEQAIFEKPLCHHFREETGEELLETHNMSQIGG